MKSVLEAYDARLFCAAALFAHLARDLQRTLVCLGSRVREEYLSTSARRGGCGGEAESALGARERNKQRGEFGRPLCVVDVARM